MLPSAEDVSPKQKARYVGYLVSNNRSRSQSNYVQLWPATGLVEALLMNRWSKPSYVIVHDPVPLRRQFGFGPIAQTLARHARLERVAIVNHSDDAYCELKWLYPHAKHVQLLHPILSAQQTLEKEEGSVLVAGQFKPARDLNLLAVLGPELRRRGLRPRIVGAGWPADIPGWEISNRFLSEEELSSEIGRAGALCVPYKRYFQSGILIRGLEMGTLSVTPTTSFAFDVLGSESGLIVHTPDVVKAWVESIEIALQRNPEDIGRFIEYKRMCDDSWARGIRELQ